jgi:hypothetical protein
VRLGYELPNRPEVLAEEWARFDAVGARVAKLRPYHLLDPQHGAANREALAARGVAIAIRPDADGPLDVDARFEEFSRAIKVLSGEGDASSVGGEGGSRTAPTEGTLSDLAKQGLQGDRSPHAGAWGVPTFQLIPGGGGCGSATAAGGERDALTLTLSCRGGREDSAAPRDSIFLILDNEPNLGSRPVADGYWDGIRTLTARLRERYGRRVAIVSPPLAVAQLDVEWFAAGREAIAGCDYVGAHAYGQRDWGLATRFLQLAIPGRPFFVDELGDSSPPSLGPRERADAVASYLAWIEEICPPESPVAAVCLFILGTTDPVWERFVLPTDVLEPITRIGRRQQDKEEKVALPADIVAVLLRLCEQYGVDPYVIAGMVWRESAWNPLAVGDYGHSVGLLQLHDAGLGAGMSVAQRQDIETNLRIGVRAFRANRDEFGTVEAAVAAHNAGGPALRLAGGDWRKVYGGSVARNYVEPVLAKADEYRRDGVLGIAEPPLAIQLDAIWGVSEQLLDEGRDDQAWTIRRAVIAIKETVGLR